MSCTVPVAVVWSVTFDVIVVTMAISSVVVSLVVLVAVLVLGVAVALVVLACGWKMCCMSVPRCSVESLCRHVNRMIALRL